MTSGISIPAKNNCQYCIFKPYKNHISGLISRFIYISLYLWVISSRLSNFFKNEKLAGTQVILAIYRAGTGRVKDENLFIQGLLKLKFGDIVLSFSSLKGKL